MLHTPKRPNPATERARQCWGMADHCRFAASPASEFHPAFRTHRATTRQPSDHASPIVSMPIRTNGVHYRVTCQGGMGYGWQGRASHSKSVRLRRVKRTGWRCDGSAHSSGNCGSCGRGWPHGRASGSPRCAPRKHGHSTSTGLVGRKGLCRRT